MEGPQVWIIDPSLMDQSGHHLGLDFALADEFSRKGFRTTIFSNCRFDNTLHSSPCRVIAHFSNSGYAEDTVNSPGKKHSFRQELKSIKGAHNEKAAMVVFQNLPIGRLIDAASWAREYSFVNQSAYFVFVLMDGEAFVSTDPTGDDQAISSGHAKFVSKLNCSALNSRHVLLIETESLIEKYTKIGVKDVNIIRSPHIKRTQILANAMAKSENEGPRLNARTLVGYLGHSARRGKGLQHVPGALKFAFESAFDFQVFCQIDTIRSLAYSDDLKDIVSDLHDLDFDVEIYYGSLSENEFYEKLVELDILLLPYSDLYKYNGSGIFYEAFSIGICTVMPSDSFMAKVAKDFGAKAFTFDEWTHSSIGAALCAALGSFRGYSEANFVAGNRWQKENSLSEKLDIIISRAKIACG